MAVHALQPSGVPPAPVAGARPLHLPALTGLRFLAASWVVLFHYTGYFFGHSLPLPPVLAQIAGAGAQGVNLFFLLSGFVLAYTYLAPDGQLRGTVRTFYRARFARIYPLYLLALMLELPYATWPTHSLTTALASLFLVQTWLPWYGLGWNAVGWTLSVEMCFYAVFPLVAGRIVHSAHPVRQLVWWWIVSQIAPFIDTLVGQQGTCSFTGSCSSYVIMHMPLFRLPEFALGIALATLYRRRPVPPHWLRVAVLPALLAGIFVSHLLPYEMVWNGLLDMLYAGVLYVVAASRGVLAARPLRLLGEASYAIYLLQWAVWDWLTHGRIVPLVPTTVTLMTYVGCLLLTALAAYRYLETPARRAIRAMHLTAPP